MLLRVFLVAALGSAVAGCTLDKLPTASTPVASPAPPVATPPLPTAVPGVLTLAMPIDGADAASVAFGMIPFGYHGGEHTQDGHAGWDIEYRTGAQVRAAAAGIVIGLDPDPVNVGRTLVQLEHVIGSHFYRTSYSNLVTVNEVVVVDAEVASGQPIGMPGIVSGVADTPATYAISHFQLDDLEFHREVINPKAVSPEPFLSSAAKTLFDRIWSNARYFHELVEPFATNARETVVTQRTWMREGGDGPPGIRFTRQGGAYTYELLAESGTVVEAGTVVLRYSSTPSTIDLIAPTATRLGTYDIISNEMRLALGSPGIQRPDISAASIYRIR
jgi:hypothetical protein